MLLSTISNVTSLVSCPYIRTLPPNILTNAQHTLKNLSYSKRVSYLQSPAWCRWSLCRTCLEPLQRGWLLRLTTPPSHPDTTRGLRQALSCGWPSNSRMCVCGECSLHGTATQKAQHDVNFCFSLDSIHWTLPKHKNWCSFNNNLKKSSNTISLLWHLNFLQNRLLFNWQITSMASTGCCCVFSLNVTAKPATENTKMLQYSSIYSDQPVSVIK